jgi:PKD repeat protein
MELVGVRKLLSGALVAVLMVSAQTLVSPVAQAADTGNTAPQSGKIVSEEPGKNAPHILDGTVYSITEVGNTVVVGGQFTQVRNYNTSTTLTRHNVFAFDATTGRVSSTFVPEPDNTVYKVQAAADGKSVYVGGRFGSVGGRSTPSRLFKADVSTGAIDTTFAPPTISGDIRDLEVVGNRLWVAGKFTHIGANVQRALATINATTGKYDSYFTGVLAGTRRDITKYPSDVTNVVQISSNPSNTRMTVVGNFTSVDGATRWQIAMFDISGSDKYALSPWTTSLFTSNCSSKFETYMTDVEYSPDGRFFVVSTSGAWGGLSSATGGSGCDVVARFEGDTNAAGAVATWTAYTGGDTTWTVEVTDHVVYAGGHQSWQNNPIGKNVPAQGAVERTGIAALNPVNGQAYSWNPTRSRGVGVQDMLATSEGLYVGSDTDLFGKTPGNTYHARIAFLPLATGKRLPVISPFTLPGNLYFVASGGTQLVRRAFSGTTQTSSASAPNGPGWSTTVGAFMVNGILYKALSNGSLSKQAFDGTTYGTASPVNAADALVYQTDWHTDVKTITSLFYAGGYIYYTKSGVNALYRRGFETESEVVGQQRFSTTASAPNWANIRGAFVANGLLYYASYTGRLYSATWNQAAHGPVPGTSVQRAASGWASRALFPYQAASGPVNEPPMAAADVSCDKLACSFDARGSSDPEGGALTYDWDFGDGSVHGSGATTTHDYASAGDRPVTLKVTDPGGATSTVTRTASPTDTEDTISFVAKSRSNGNRADHTVTVPPGTQVGDTLLLFFVGNSRAPVYAGPSGWQQVLADDGDTFVGRLYTKKATSSDLGSTVTVTSRYADGTSYLVKDDVTLAAYRGVGSSGVTDAASVPQDVPDSAHQTPTVHAPDGSGWLVSYWADKSSTTTSWTGPPNQTQRSTGAGSGTSHMSSLLTDSGRRVSSGIQGRLNATADSSAVGLTMSVLLEGNGTTEPPNQAPVALAGLVGCTDLTCSFDGSGSSDPDGEVLTYEWDWGDGTPSSTGATPSHTFASGGAKVVTLTVTDPQAATGEDTVTATPTAEAKQAEAGNVASNIDFVGATATNGNRLTHAAAIPSGVSEGDTLVVFFTANSTSPTYTGPTGWTLLASEDGSGIVTRAWTKTASAADLIAGASVAVTSSGYVKSDITVAAYEGTDAAAPIAVSTVQVDNTVGAAHTSPAVTAVGSRSWLVTYWSDKSSETSAWTAPAGQSERASTFGSGSGHISALLTDGNGPVDAGARGGLTATASSTSSRGASFSVLLTSS